MVLLIKCQRTGAQVNFYLYFFTCIFMLLSLSPNNKDEFLKQELSEDNAARQKGLIR